MAYGALTDQRLRPEALGTPQKLPYQIQHLDRQLRRLPQPLHLLLQSFTWMYSSTMRQWSRESFTPVHSSSASMRTA